MQSFRNLFENIQSFRKPLKLRVPIFLIQTDTPQHRIFVPDFTAMLYRYFHLRSETYILV